MEIGLDYQKKKKTV